MLLNLLCWAPLASLFYRMPFLVCSSACLWGKGQALVADPATCVPFDVLALCYISPGVVWLEALSAVWPVCRPQHPVPTRAAVPGEGSRPVFAAALRGLGRVWC